MGKSTIYMAILKSYVSLPEGNISYVPIISHVYVNPTMGMLSHWLSL